MFFPDPDSWPYTNFLESIYKGNSANTEGTLSGMAAAYRAREERRVVEGWENEQEQEKETGESTEVRRKLPERALKILHRAYPLRPLLLKLIYTPYKHHTVFFQNISPSPSPAQQTDLLTYIHAAIPGAEWFGPNDLRAWFISRRSEGTARRLLDEVAVVQRRSEEQQVLVRAQGTQRQKLVYRERSDEKDVVTCGSILYPTLTTPKITKLAILYRNNPTPNKNAIEVWARALKADVEDVVNWVQIHGGGGSGRNNIPLPVANSHSQNLPPTTSLPANVEPQHTPIPWWPSTAALPAPPPPPPPSPPSPPSHTSPSRSPAPQPQHAHETETSHIPYRRHPVPHHDFRTQYRGATTRRNPVNPYGRVYRPPVEVCPTTTTASTSDRSRRPPPSLLSGVRHPSHHPTLEARTRRGGELRPIRPCPSSSPSTSPIPFEFATATTTTPNYDVEELFDPATLLPPISVPAQYRQPLSHTLPYILPPSHPRRPLRRTRTHSHPHSQPPPHPYSHLLRHILAHTHTQPRSHSHTPHKDQDVDHNGSRWTSESPVVDHDLEFPSAARSSLSAVVPPSFDFDLGPSVFSPSALSVRSRSQSGTPVIDLTGPDDDIAVVVPMDFEPEESATVSTTQDVDVKSFLPPASTHPTFAELSDSPCDEDEDDSEPMDLESDDDDAPSIFELRHHLAKEPKVRRNLLVELAKFVDQCLAHSGGDIRLAKGEQVDFEAALGVCEVFYERIKSGVYAGIGTGARAS